MNARPLPSEIPVKECAGTWIHFGPFLDNLCPMGKNRGSKPLPEIRTRGNELSKRALLSILLLELPEKLVRQPYPFSPQHGMENECEGYR